MSEIAIRDETAPAVRGELAVPAMNDMDSWTQIVGQVVRLANEIYDTPFVPDGLRGSSPAVAAAILAGREMGLGPMTSLANIDVIRGKPTQKPLLMRAMILSRGHKWEDVETNDVRAVVRGCRKGESVWTTVTFSAEQARKAGLDLGKYPGDKLYARATSRLAKHKFADVIMGMAYSSDDVEDGLDAEIAVTETAAAAAPPADQPKPRTARRARTQSTPPAQPAPVATAPKEPAGGAPQPPLPGEDDDASPSAPASSSLDTPGSGPDDTDYDTPGTVTPQQLTKIWTTLTGDLGFKHDEKEQAREICAQIVRRDLESSKDLSHNEARTVIDTLSQVGSREDLMALLIAAEKEVPDGE